MTPKQEKIVKICFIILAISMAVMAISSVIQIVNEGWESLNMITVIPFIGIIVSMIVIFASGKKPE
ncbi:MAG: hypothetical protein FWE14_09210 [Lachnospiraceae bacterium]|nr:hypothetical protein [Lachnospiraceae bacterium]